VPAAEAAARQGENAPDGPGRLWQDPPESCEQSERAGPPGGLGPWFPRLRLQRPGARPRMRVAV